MYYYTICILSVVDKSTLSFRIQNNLMSAQLSEGTQSDTPPHTHTHTPPHPTPPNWCKLVWPSVVWVLCGVISTLGALTFAELGTTYPVSGSMYVYLQKMYGPFVAFQYQWEYYLLHRPAANAIKSLLFALYVIQPFFPGCDPPDLAVKLIAVAFASKCSGVAREGGGGARGDRCRRRCFLVGIDIISISSFLIFFASQ